MNPLRWSLRWRVLLITAVACLVAWLLGGAAIYFVVQREDALLFDSRLENTARTLLGFGAHEIREVEAERGRLPMLIENDEHAHERYRFQIWSTDGRLLLASRNAPQTESLMPLAQSGWVTRSLHGEAIRVLSLRDAETASLIQVAEPLAERLGLTEVFSRQLAAGLGLAAAALAGLTSLFLRRAMRPLHEVANDIAGRGPSNLGAVATSGLPQELSPMVDAVNQLMQRLDAALRSERGFVAAAAHELRTPLAGLRAQAQLAAHPLTSGDTRTNALAAVQDGVDHAAHLIQQLLELARSDALAGDPARLREDLQWVDLGEVVAELRAEFAAAAEARQLRWIEELQAPAVFVSPFALRLMLRNLIANALAYGGQGGTVRIASQRGAGVIAVLVEDDGPGVHADELERIFERFYRSKGNPVPGCGLGLAIVKALADAHGARLVAERSVLGGLRVEARFAAPPA